MPRPLGDIIWAPAWLSPDEAVYQNIWSLFSSSSFEDMFDRMPKIEGSRDLGHAPFGAFQVEAV